MSDVVHALARAAVAALVTPEPARRYRPLVTERTFTNPHASSFATYPSPRPVALQDQYARVLGELHPGADVVADNVMFVPGSIAGIDLLIRAFCEPSASSICVTPPTFPAYAQFARIGAATVRSVPLRGQTYDALDVDAVLAQNATITFLCNPTSPVGSVLAFDAVREVAARSRGLVVVDEAYMEFWGVASAICLLRELPNVVVLRTFSKAWGLAGLRAGAVVAEPSILAALRRIQEPFAFHSAAQSAVAERLADPGRMRGWVAVIVAERERVRRRLLEFAGVRNVFPSSTNFLCLTLTDSALSAALFEQGCLVSDASHVVADCIRLSIGACEDNERALNLLAGGPQVEESAT